MSQTALQALFNPLGAPKAPSRQRRYTEPTRPPQLPNVPPNMAGTMRAQTHSSCVTFKVITGLVHDIQQFYDDMTLQAQMDVAGGRYAATPEEIEQTALAEATLYSRYVHDALCWYWERILQGSADRPTGIPMPPPDFIPPDYVTSGQGYDPTKG